MTNHRQITRDDILDPVDYARQRKEYRRRAIEVKKQRRLDVGPYATFYFENYDTMLAQVQEMLWIEKGGEEQLADELSAYNPLIPQGRELVATFMIQIDDPVRRLQVLQQLTHIEDHIAIEVGGEKISAVPDEDGGVERTKEDGKTSSIHFLHFPMSEEQAAAFKSGEGQAVISVSHAAYGHMAVIPDEMRRHLAADLD